MAAEKGAPPFVRCLCISATHHPCSLSLHLPLFSYGYKMQISQLLSFDIHAKCRGCMGSFLRLPTTHHSLRTLPFLFTFFRTFLHSRKTQLFYFQAIPHSLHKTPGVGVGRTSCSALAEREHPAS